MRLHRGFKPLANPIIIGTASPGAEVMGISTGSITDGSPDTIDVHGAVCVPGITRDLLSIGSLCDTTRFGFLHTSTAVLAIPKGDIDISGYARVGVRGVHTNLLYVADPKCFAFGSAPDAVVSDAEYAALMDSPGGDCCSLGALLNAFSGWSANAVDPHLWGMHDYAALGAMVNPAITFHNETHASAKYMRLIVLRPDLAVTKHRNAYEALKGLIQH